MTVMTQTRDQTLAEILEECARLWVKIDGAKLPKGRSMYLNEAQKSLRIAQKYVMKELGIK